MRPRNRARSNRTRRVLRQRDKLKSRLSSTVFTLNADTLTGEFELPQLDLRATFAVGDAPILFLPVRLETRFFQSELQVRIYPDQIHLNTHAESLTRREIALGEMYWRQREQGDSEVALDSLVSRLPPRRALWVARETRPISKDGKLVFPRHTPRTGRKTAIADLLPERWAIAGFVDNQRRFVEFTNDITTPLAFAPDFQDISNLSNAGKNPLEDEPVAWMIDFEQAVSKGMGIRIGLQDFDFGDSGLTLLAVGIGNQQQPRQALGKHLQAHRYSDGLSITPQGTPTNNTDATIAGWSAGITDVSALFANELDDNTMPAPESAAAELNAAFGLQDDSVLALVENAHLDEVSAMRAMNRLLWPVTWGRYLNDLLANDEGASIIATSKQAAIRQFFIEHVRGGASLPVLNIGAQPYGVLPTMRRDGGDFNSADPLIALEAIVLEMRERFRESLPGVVRLDPVDGGTTDDAAAELLGTVAHPIRFVVRRLTWQWALRTGVWKGLWDSVAAVDEPNPDNRPFAALAFIKSIVFQTIDTIDEEIQWLRDLRQDPQSLGIDEDQVEATQTILDAFIAMCESHRDRQSPLHEWYPDAFSGVLDEDVTTDPKIIYADYGNATADESFNHPLVASPHASALRYLNHLRERVQHIVPDSNLPNTPQTSSPSTDDAQVVVTAASKASGSSASLAASRQRNAFLPSRLHRSATNRSIQTALSDRGDSNGGSVSNDDFDIDIDHTLPLPTEFFDSQPLLYQLVDSVVDDITPLEGGTYRSALSTLANLNEEELTLRFRETLGLANNRLDAWYSAFASAALNDVRKAGDHSLLLGGFGWVEGLRADAKGVRESTGFIHAPSIAHATTAAVLRAGYHAHGSDDPAAMFAVDLRSARVRTATWLLDGVRQGQALGDLLGIRFERQLHDSEIDQFIDDCRRRVLEADGSKHQPRGPVDGLKLADLYRSTGVRITTTTGDRFIVRPGTSQRDPSYRGLQAALDDLLTSMDTVADASIADSVHHLLQGNSTRASATLDTLATGEGAPSDLRSMDSEHGGAEISHRVLITLHPDDRSLSKWARSDRVLLEPALAGWAARQLGDPSRIRCQVHIDMSEAGVIGEDVVNTVLDVSMADLVRTQGIGALDAILETQATWEARVRAQVLSQDSFAAFEEAIRVEHAPPLPTDDMTFDDAAMLAGKLRNLLSVVRPVDARDFATPGSTMLAGLDIAGAEIRLTNFHAILAKQAQTLKNLLPIPDKNNPRPVGDGKLVDLRSQLMRLANLGIGSPVVHGYSESGRDKLYAVAWSRLAQVESRLTAYAALAAPAVLNDKVVALLGKSLPLLPVFVTGEDAPEVFSHSEELLPSGSADAMLWLDNLAHVRANVQSLVQVNRLGELLHDTSGVAPVVGQLPHVANETWVANNSPSRTGESRLALLAFDYGGLDELKAARPAAGLMVDAWSEQIPARDAVTGVAVHHDAPTSQPPQSMLLAMPPAGRQWNFDHVIDNLLDTFEAAKLRSVDTDILLAYGHQLPAIFAPQNIRSGSQEANND